MNNTLRGVTRPLFVTRQGLIGVDFGTRMMKFAQLRSSLRSWKLTAVHSTPIATSQGLTASSIGRGAIRESLKGMSRSASGFVGPRAVVALPTELAEPRPFELPQGDLGELARMLDQELSSPQTSQSDFWDCGAFSRTDTELRRVNAVEVADSVLNRCIEDLARAGLECEVIDVLPFALARAIDFVERSPVPGSVLALDWGAGQPLLVLIENGQPVFTRVLRDCALGKALDRIQSQLGIDEIECAQLLATCGIDGRGEGSRIVAEIISRHLVDEVEQMLETLHRTMEFLQREHGETPNRMWLFGCGGAIRGLDDVLSEQLELETRTWALEKDQLSRSLQSLTAQCVFGAAVGLSLLEVTDE